MTNNRVLWVVGLAAAGAIAWLAASAISAEGEGSEGDAAAKPAESPAGVAATTPESPADAAAIEAESAAAAAQAADRSAVSGGKGEYEWVAAVDYAIPSDSGMWDDALGFEAAIRKWFENGWGVGLTFWSSSWDLASDPEVPQEISGRHDPEVTGSADLMAPGASALYRWPLGERWKVLLDAGLRYVFVDSSVELMYSYREHYGNRIHVVSEVTIEDRLQGTVGATVSGQLRAGSRWDLFAGVGYAFDLGASDENWLYENVANDLGALVVRAGVGF